MAGNIRAGSIGMTFLRSLESRLAKAEQAASAIQAARSFHCVRIIGESEAEIERQIAEQQSGGIIQPHTFVIAQLIVSPPAGARN